MAINDTLMKDCFVAFLDILGFSNMAGKSEMEDNILSIFESAPDKNTIQMALHKAVPSDDDSEEGLFWTARNNALDSISIYLMSDSIVVSISSDIPFALEELIEVCRMIQYQLLILRPPVLLRGAIAKGLYFTNNRIAFGKAMVDAHYYEEHFSKYPRIIISDSLIKQFLDESAMVAFLHKDKNDFYYYIDTLKEYFIPGFQDDPEINIFKEFINDQLSNYEEPGIREKYIWLKKEISRIEYLIKYKYERNSKADIWYDPDSGDIINNDSLRTDF